MQLRKVVLLDATNIAVIQEMRVRDVRYLVTPGMGLTDKPLTDLLGERFVIAEAFVQQLVDLPAAWTFANLTGEQLGALMIGWDDVNQALYKVAKKGPNPTHVTRDLDKACVALIGMGHAEVWDYGWGFFMTVLDTLKT